MVSDIVIFGEKMRNKYLPDDFGWQGKAVLMAIGFYYVSAGSWLRAAAPV
jgi:hypothetical protein